MLLLLVAGSGLAREPQPTGPSDAVGVNASSAANAPWFNIEVDTLGNVGQYTSVVIDRSGTWIPYRNVDFASIAVSQSGMATVAYNGFITSSDGNLSVSYQRLQVFLPSVMKNQ